MIRIAVVEDETLVRQGIAELLGLEPRFQVVIEAATGEEILRLLPEVRPDMVLVDVRLPCLSGPEVLERLRDQTSEIPVILITTFDNEALLRGMRAGARGYLRYRAAPGHHRPRPRTPARDPSIV